MIRKRRATVKAKRIAKKVSFYVTVVLLMIFCVFPFYWMIVCSLKTIQELFRVIPTLIPSRPILTNFSELLKTTFYPSWFANTAIVALCTTGICILVATLAAYSLSRYRYRGRLAVSNFILFVYMFPPILLAIPLYFMAIRFRLTNTLSVLIITYIAQALPYVVWLLRAFFNTIPVQMEEAAMIDGASGLQVIRKIVLPLALPGIIATTVFCLNLAWNEYLFALFFISSNDKKTIPLGLMSFITTKTEMWGLIFAGSVLSAIPILLLFFYIQKFLIEAWGSGGMKG